jgi:vesicular inhibitory amino acid transporter
LIDTDVFTLRPSVIADMAGAAYGARGRILISTMFMLELIAASVALIVLFADSLHVLFPDISTITFKVMAFFILTPTTYLAIRHLSYTSFVGILSSFTLVAVIFYDGATKLEHPGSLTDPMPTTLLPIHWMTLPLAFGQVAAGFAGHATFPSVYRDMAEPEDFPRVVNYTYLATSLIYAFMASAGYLMFGKDVSVITENMMHTPGFNLVLNKLAVWLIVINPFTKYALTLSGVNFTIELSIFRHPALGSITKSKLSMRLVQFVTRLLVSSVVVLIAILFPAFDRVIVSAVGTNLFPFIFLMSNSTVFLPHPPIAESTRIMLFIFHCCNFSFGMPSKNVWRQFIQSRKGYKLDTTDRLCSVGIDRHCLEFFAQRRDS